MIVTGICLTPFRELLPNRLPSVQRRVVVTNSAALRRSYARHPLRFIAPPLPMKPLFHGVPFYQPRRSLSIFAAQMGGFFIFLSVSYAGFFHQPLPCYNCVHSQKY